MNFMLQVKFVWEINIALDKALFFKQKVSLFFLFLDKTYVGSH